MVTVGEQFVADPARENDGVTDREAAHLTGFQLGEFGGRIPDHRRADPVQQRPGRDHRGFRGIGRHLYDLRKDLVVRHGKRGIIAGGDLPGFPAHADEMDVETYVAKVVAGELSDPTLTMQLNNGFEVRGVIHDYMPHHHGEDHASLIVWESPG